MLGWNRNEPVSVLRNDLGGDRKWVKLKLVGTKANRSAIGARVVLQYGARKQGKAVTSQASFYSVNDTRLHFGLGSETTANATIHWPGGKTETVNALPANHLITIREGEGVVKKEPLGAK